MIDLMSNLYTNLGEYLSFSQSSISELLLGYNKKPKTDEPTGYGRWHELPKDIMEIIIQRLNSTDRVRLSIVCKSWRPLVMQKDIPAAPQIPWLLLPHGPDCKRLSFYSLEEGKVHNLKLPKSAQGGWCCGSSKGWLVISKETSFKSEIFLLNPISGARRQLPSLTTIPSFDTFVESLPDDHIVSSFINRIELSSSDTSDCVVAAIFDSDRILAFCRPEDKSWSIFEGRDEDEEFIYHDILFSNETLYVLPSRKINGVFTAVNCTFGFEDREVDLKFLPALRIPEPEFVGAIEVFDDYRIVQGGLLDTYLVESINGELMVIFKIMDVLQGKDEEDEEEAFDVQYYRAREFEVYKVDPNNGTCCMTCRLKDLGGQVLFLTNSGSVSLQARDFNGFQGNCIYFAADRAYYNDHHPLVSRDPGVFYLDDGRIERSFPSVDLPIHSMMSWFTPIPW
ncbi:hypothetical protein L1049_015776 [Liquidambar formosana]|uniref:F-box domain-containing protein n=1 Tax=Liquidambar formosana TaxID=63359 RepID=A0AAP0S4N1_LIQFO